MTLYRYRAEFDVHAFDCGGRVDVERGLQRLEQLQLELDARPAPDGLTKLLVDFRQTTWTTPDVHLQLARATRQWLEAARRTRPIRVAFVHQQQRGVLSPNEAWFDEEGPALHWLTRVDP